MALIAGVLIGAALVSELAPVQELCARIDAVREAAPWLLALPIGLIVAGSILMLGAQFLPSSKEQAPLSNEALDAATAPIGFNEERGRWTRSIQMEATVGQVREAFRRRSWRYSRVWRMFMLMLIGAALVSLGITLLFILIGPSWLKVLAFGWTAGVALWILRAFTLG